MFLATHTDATLCLNASNHASIPPTGLTLVANVPTEVPAEQAEYLATLGVHLLDLTPTKSARSPKE
jgi:hypothetical protein